MRKSKAKVVPLAVIDYLHDGIFAQYKYNVPRRYIHTHYSPQEKQESLDEFAFNCQSGIPTDVTIVPVQDRFQPGLIPRQLSFEDERV